MSRFTQHTFAICPQQLKQQCEEIKKEMGFIPNYFGIMVESPELVKGYSQLNHYMGKVSFNAEEIMVIWQTINIKNNAKYCTALHAYNANKVNLNPLLMKKLASGEPLLMQNLQALKCFVLNLLEGNGHVSDQQLNAFYAAGYKQKQVLEIILIIGQRTISNYVNNVANTKIDDAFKPFVI